MKAFLMAHITKFLIAGLIGGVGATSFIVADKLDKPVVEGVKDEVVQTSEQTTDQVETEPEPEEPKEEVQEEVETNYSEKLSQQLAEEKRQLEELQKQQEEARRQQEASKKQQEELRRQQEELKRQQEAQRLAEQQKQAEELKRLQEEQKRLEEQKKAQEQAKLNEQYQRLQKANQIMVAIEPIAIQLRNQADSLAQQINAKLDEIEKTKNQPILGSIVQGQLAKLNSELNSLIIQYDNVKAQQQRFMNILYRLQDYGDMGTPLPAEDRTFLAQWGIYW